MENDRGKALSFATFGGQIGIMFLPIIVVKLMNIIDWQQVWLISSLTLLIFFVPFMFVALNNQNIRHSNFKNSYNQLKDKKIITVREIFFDKKFYIYLPLSIAAPFISTGFNVSIKYLL